MLTGTHTFLLATWEWINLKKKKRKKVNKCVTQNVNLLFNWYKTGQISQNFLYSLCSFKYIILVGHYLNCHLWHELRLNLGWSFPPGHVTPCEPVSALRPWAFAVWGGDSSWRGWRFQCEDGEMETGCTGSPCLPEQTDLGFIAAFKEFL